MSIISARRYASLVDVGPGPSLYLRAQAHLARELFAELGLHLPRWSERGGGYPVARSLAGDVLAAADHNGVHVTLPKAKPEPT